MMKTTTEVTMETLLVSALNVAAVYTAAFTYKMNWTGVMTVMVIASLITATIVHFILGRLMAAKQRTETLLSEGSSVLSVAFISSMAVLVMLTYRFNLPEALGISLLSGMLTAFIRHIFGTM